MSPPKFSDLHEEARDLISKGYNYGLCKLEFKSKSTAGLHLLSNCTINNDTKLFAGNLKLQHKLKDYGLEFVTDFTNEAQITNQLHVKNCIVNGLGLSFETMFVPSISKKTASIKSSYKTKNTHSTADLYFDFTGTHLDLSTILKSGSWFGGVMMKLDETTPNKKIWPCLNWAVGYKTGDLTVVNTLSDSTEYQSSICQKISKDLKFGILIDYSKVSNDSKMTFGAKYNHKKMGVFKIKMNSHQQIGISYQLDIKKGVTLILSTQLECDRKSLIGHKMGAGLMVDL
ncbi:hypothetical protein HELRODRAFT_87388 [Helobdella robusta]|uniref:Voltage-dependent anion-selective channel protein 3 n=1 Tax=Helobdella robusta TaxID=6412 RepID=T1G6P5_HELRO|nr:hypothetical protein HELRODRAFT_87388 [Helobdella robusta]ESN95054.1 hypothetical protein HELRODRAFT_87388 [Helobdella robusta]